MSREKDGPQSVTKDILQLVQEKEEEAGRNRRRGCIICPGAIGDCLLTLPLASYLKSAHDLGGMDFIGRTEYIDFYPGRTCVDSIRSIESIDFHRLFEDHRDFTVEENDRLVGSFASYERIVSFMGAGDPNFEANLIFAVNCSRPADVTVLPMTDTAQADTHISEFYIRAYMQENESQSAPAVFDAVASPVRAHFSDAEEGRRLLEAEQISPDDRLVVIHPGSGGLAKCWHPDNFCDVARRLRRDHIQVVFVIGPAELERLLPETLSRFAEIAPCLSGLDLGAVLQVLTWADAYLGNDSGISHLAGALGKTTVALFGPSNSRRYRPVGPRVHVATPPAASFVQRACEEAESIHDTVLHVLDG